MKDSLRVLFAEDNEDDLFLVLRELRKGFPDIHWSRVDTAAAMRAALAGGAWDLVISDHSMPIFSSHGALEEVRAAGLDLPFIIVSGVAGEEIVTAAMRQGAHDFISKGSLTRLLPAVQRELRESEMRREGRQLGAQLQASERRYGTLFNENPVPMLLIDAGTLLIVDANPAAAAFFGFSLATLKQAGLRALGGSNSGAIGRTIRDHLSQSSHQFRDQVRVSDGSLRDVLILACTLHQGARTLFYATIFDETERRAAEAARTRLAAAVEQVEEAIVITEPGGSLVYANPAFEALAERMVPEDAAGGPAGRLDSASCPDLAQRMEEAARGNGRWEGRLLFRSRDGRNREVDTVISPVRDERGALLQLVAVLRDMTRELELERHLRQVEKIEALATLAAGITHDFNNVLSTILSAAELVKWKLPPDSPLISKVDAILQAAMLAAGLNRQILAFSRREDEKRVPMDLSASLKDSLHILRNALPAGIRMRSDLSSGIWVEADPSQMHQVVMNLAINAFHAMREGGGDLDVSLCERDLEAGARLLPPELPAGRYAHLIVRDSGHGMDAATQGRIFEPFFTTKLGQEGTGLGLAMVQATVLRLGGSITVESEPGDGCLFQVLIPCARGAGTQAAAGADAEDLGGAEHILFVDDEEVLAVLAKQGLQALGYTVTVRSSGKEALEVFRKDPGVFDLIITDLVMPDMNGAELANRILEIRPEIPVLAISGLPPATVLAMDAHAAFQGVLTKPFTPFDLARHARRALFTARSFAPAPAAGDKERRAETAILLAEDSHVTRSLLRMWLERAGYQVLEARDGQEAWELYCQAAGPAVNLLLTDVEMPRMNGIQLATRIRKADPSIPVAILTSNEDRETVKAALHLGADEFLNKPFQAPEILRCVERLLDERSHRMEARRSAETAKAVRMAQKALVAVPEKDLPLFSLYEPLTDAGGDVFRGLRCEDGSIFFALADVAGHSVGSSYAVAAFLAMFTAYQGECACLRSASTHGAVPAEGPGGGLRTCGLLGRVPCDPLRHMALKLNAGIQDGPFAEVPVCTLLGHWEPATGRLHLLSAGIPHGLLCRARDGGCRPIELNGVPLGALPDLLVEETVVYLEPGDRLLFGTDGFFELPSPSKELFEDLAPAQWAGFRGTPLDWALSLICEVARNHGEGVLTDDLLVVGFEQPPLEPAPDSLSLRLPSTAKDVDAGVERFSAFLGSHGTGGHLDPGRRFDIALAVREALVNAVGHGNAGRPEAQVELRARRRGEDLQVRVADEGRGFVLAAYTPPGDPLSDRGRGVPLMRNAARSVRMVGSELVMDFEL